VNNAVPQPVFVRQFGQGPRRVLALHCTIAHSGAWRGVAGAMADEATFITPDMLSHGRSPDWDRRGDIQDRSVAAVVHLLDQPMDVIGHSFGGTVALRLAVEHPELVRTLTMIEPVCFAVAKLDDPAIIAAHDHDAAPFMAALEAGDEALGARLFNRMWSTEDSPRWPDLPQSTRDAMTRSIHFVPASKPAAYDDRAGMLNPGVLDRAAMPVLLLRGSLTHPVMQVVDDGLARRLPDAQSVEVPGAGHMLPITHPVETAGHLRALFARAPV
jgi:lipase